MKTFDPDDPMLTAYALGELEGEELREVEELIARDPAAARHVESVRTAAAGFDEAFEREEAPAVEPIRAVEIEPRRPSPFIPFLFYASTAAAACFFVVIAIRLVNPGSDVVPMEQKAEAQVDALGKEAKKANLERDAEAAKVSAVRQEAEDRRKMESRAMADAPMNEVAAAPAPAASPDRLRIDADKKDAAFAGAASGEKNQAVLAAPATATALGETKTASKSAPAGAIELDDSGVPEGDEIRLKPFSIIASGPQTFRTVVAIQDALNSNQKVTRIDVAPLLADLGFKEPLSKDQAASEVGNLAQTTVNASPEPDPEAALVRAVERLAELVALNTPANNESWDRVLYDARYAAGDDEKRKAFVEVIEELRKRARGADAH